MCVCEREGGRDGGRGMGVGLRAEREREKKKGAKVKAREKERDLLSHPSPCTLYCPFSICSSTAAVTLHLRGQRVCEERGMTAVKLA